MTEQEKELMAVLEKRFQNWIISKGTEQSLCNDIKEYIPLYIKKYETNEELAKINISNLLNTYQKDKTRLILHSDINRLLAKYSSSTAPVQQNATLHSQQTSLVSNIERVMQETIQQLTENKVLLTEQIDLLKRQVELLEKKLDDMQTTNQQLKQQINTLQSKGVNISQQGQQWEYKVIDPFRDGGCYELTEDGDTKLKKDIVNSSRSRMTDNDWNLLASASWEFILSYSGGYNGSDGYVLLRRPISVRRYYEQKRKERLDLEYQRKYNVF